MLEGENSTHSFKEITSIRVCVECFVAFDVSLNLSHQLFPNSIVNRYGANLNSGLLNQRIFESLYIQSIGYLNSTSKRDNTGEEKMRFNLQ